MAANKYRARTTRCHAGHSHPSAKEARRCNELHLLLRAGEISGLEREPVFRFAINGRAVIHDNGRQASYRPDFVYRRADGQQVAEDTKGYAARDWPLRKAIFRALYPDIVLFET